METASRENKIKSWGLPHELCQYRSRSSQFQLGHSSLPIYSLIDAEIRIEKPQSRICENHR
eukprot:scaffold92109_cov18-Prasinocladus_malaysianus.AAC.1